MITYIIIMYAKHKVRETQFLNDIFFYFFIFLLINSSLYSAFHEPYDMV